VASGGVVLDMPESEVVGSWLATGFTRFYRPSWHATGWCGRLSGGRTRLGSNGGERRELRMTAEASEMVTVSRAKLDALRAEVRRLRR
jgi:hypothetical protein